VRIITAEEPVAVPRGSVSDLMEALRKSVNADATAASSANARPGSKQRAELLAPKK
jgi:non-homologous end joining protein Ku